MRLRTIAVTGAVLFSVGLGLALYVALIVYPAETSCPSGSPVTMCPTPIAPLDNPLVWALVGVAILGVAVLGVAAVLWQKNPAVPRARPNEQGR